MTMGFSTRAVSAPAGVALRNRFGKEPVKYVPLSQFFTSRQRKDGEDDDAIYGRRARPRKKKKGAKASEGPQGSMQPDTDDETRRTKKNPTGAAEAQDGVFLTEPLVEGKICWMKGCSSPATKQIVWADGRATFPVCDACVEAGKKYLKKKNGKWAEIVAVQSIKEAGSGQPVAHLDESAAHVKSIALMRWLSRAAKELRADQHIYVVGGAVRNFVIDKPIKDVDVVLDAVALGRGRDSAWFAKQLQKRIGARSKLATNQYGVAILTVSGDWEVDGHNLKGEVIEIANARSESYGGEVGKGYKPSDVQVAPIEKDVKRREFTFNCMGGDTLIPTEMGILRIDKIADRTDGDRQSIELRVAGQDGPAVAAGWQYSGHTDTLRVKTEWGHTFTCTYHHPVLVLRGHEHEWVQADQLEDSDLLCVPVRQMVRQAPLTLDLSDPVPPKHGRLKEIRKPEVMTPELAYVLGCLVAEGSNTAKRVSFSNSDNAFIARYAECFQATFGFAPSRNQVVAEGDVRVLDGVEFRATRDGFDIYADSRTLVGWFDELGLYCGGAWGGKSASHHKIVPWSILEADEKSQAAFLAAYLEGDGSIRPDSGRITYCSVSPHIRQQLQVLLGAHGILSKVKGRFVYVNAVDSAKLWSKIEAWMVTKRFDYDGVSFKSRNRYGVQNEHLAGWLKGRRVSVGNNTGASIFRTDDGDEVSLAGMTEALRRPKRILHDSVARGDYDTFMVGLKMVSPTEYAKVQRLLDLEYQYVEVASVENAGQQDVYDLSMHEGVEPAFVANGVIVHNTLMWRLADLAKGPDKAEIIDLAGCGLKDLKARTMRCPSDPDKTFSDDPTRMLRAIKFMNKYGFKISPDTEASIRRNASKLRNAPSAAIAKLLVDVILKEPRTAKKALGEMKRLGLLDVVAQMAQDDASFRATLSGWANDQRVALLFHLLDLGLPLKTKLGAFEPAEQKRIRVVTATMPDAEASEYLAALKQPGRAWKDKLFFAAMAADLGATGKGIGKLAQRVNGIARDAMLSDPKLVGSPEKLKRIIRDAIKDSGARFEAKTRKCEFCQSPATHAVRAQPTGLDVCDEHLKRAKARLRKMGFRDSRISSHRMATVYGESRERSNCDFGSSAYYEFVKKNQCFRTREFEEFVTDHNKAGRDSGELQDIAMHEVERLAREFAKKVEGMTTTANIATTPVPVGAGDGRKFLDFGPGHPFHGRDFGEPKKKRKRKKKRQGLSQRLSYLLTIP